MTHGRKHLFSKALFQSSAPFSHVVIANDVGYVSGIIGQHRVSGAVVGADAATQTKMTLDNLELALTETGFGLRDLVATRLYLLDYADFDAINSAYRQRLQAPFPARTTLQVSGLPLNARVQIDAVFDARKVGLDSA